MEVISVPTLGLSSEMTPEDDSDLRASFRPGKNHLEPLACFLALKHPSGGTHA